MDILDIMRDSELKAVKLSMSVVMDEASHISSVTLAYMLVLSFY